jgi:hypothetical protein
MNYDTSTINEAALSRLPVFECPPSYHLQREPGNDCYGDPPGYPSYFTQSVYTQYGNSPGRRGTAETVILGRVLFRVGEPWDDEKRAAKLRRLWNPLPLDHPRTTAWIQATYKYHQHCYYHPTEPDDYGRGHKLIIWPVPYYELRSFVDDPRFSDEWREKERASIEQANKEVIEAARAVCIPENHSAAQIIQRYYPDHKPDMALIENPPDSPGNWWECYSENFTPETCPGQYNTKHPVNGSWCQMCGWKDKTGIHAIKESVKGLIHHTGC